MSFTNNDNSRSSDRDEVTSIVMQYLNAGPGMFCHEIKLEKLAIFASEQIQ